jgi:hypothetical protein
VTRRNQVLQQTTPNGTACTRFVAARSPHLDILPPNHPEGFHQRRGERIEQKTIEIGKAKWQDFITDSTLIGCDIRILCGAHFVNLFGSTFEQCTFRPRREMKNLRFTGMTLWGCSFVGRYSGCRFGKESEDEVAAVRACDFSGASLFHLCDFLDGADVSTMRWPAWPHIVVTDLPRSRAAWLRLKLPEEMRIVQEVIGDENSLSRAVSLYLPAGTDRAEELRELLASQSYLIITETSGPSDPGGIR